MMRFRARWSCTSIIVPCLLSALAISFNPPKALAAKDGAEVSPGPSAPEMPPAAPLPNVFAEQFLMSPDLRLRYPTSELKGFVFVETPERETKTNYSIVTHFGGSAIRTQALPGLKDLQEARKWIEDHLKTSEFEGAEIRELPLPTRDGKTKNRYWVGQQSFSTPEDARAHIALVKSVAEIQGGDFTTMVKEAESALRSPEEELPMEITPAQFEREEKVFLKLLDQLDIGNEAYGPFMGETVGEPVLWQSFGETSWRMTNLDKRNFSDQVGFWTNRLVIKGIRFPFNTVDPFVEMTGALESNGTDGASHLDLSAGLEWRPFARNPTVYNYRPWTLPLLEFIRNYRVYIQYFDRKNLKDEITGIKDYDFRAGVQIFYEWGIDLPGADEEAPSSAVDYLRRYVWGEYFGDYHWEKTDFTLEDDFNAFIANSSVILGFRFPGIPLPPNYVNEELVIMPYFRFEHVNNSSFSFRYQNQYFVSVGARWMPFRNYRFKDNEWLFKTKVFAEFVGVGLVQNPKQDDDTPDYDLRFGVSFSHRRF